MSRCASDSVSDVAKKLLQPNSKPTIKAGNEAGIGIGRFECMGMVYLPMQQLGVTRPTDSNKKCVQTKALHVYVQDEFVLPVTLRPPVISAGPSRHPVRPFNWGLEA